MKKISLTTIILACMLLIAYLVYHQWNVYLKDQNKGNMLVEVAHQSDKMHVTIHLSHIKPGQYNIQLSNRAQHVEGITISKGQQFIIIPSSGSIDLSYDIHLKLTKPVIIKHYLPKIAFPSTVQIAMNIELTEHQNRQGSWVVGLHTEKVIDEDIDFYRATLKSMQSELYWDPNIKSIENIGEIAVFSSQKLSDNQRKKIKNIATTLPEQEINLIFSKTFPSQAYTVGGVIHQQTDVKRIVYFTIMAQYPEIAVQSDISQSMYALFIHQPYGNDKAKYLYQQMSHKLTVKEQKEALIYFLHHPESTRMMLDRYLSKITKSTMHFFEENQSTDVPMLFYHSQQLIVAKKRYGADVIVDRESSSSWYPASKVSEGLGFSLKQQGHKIIWTRGKEVYVFYTDRPFFENSGEQYALTFPPLKKYNHTWYVNQLLLQYIFQLTITMNEKHVIVY